MLREKYSAGEVQRYADPEFANCKMTDSHIIGWKIINKKFLTKNSQKFAKSCDF
jgi:hypothetical protein